MNLIIEKYEKKSILQIKRKYSFLILSSFIFFSIGIVNLNSIFGQTAEDNDDQLLKKKNNNNNTNAEKDFTTIKVKINKNNIDVKNDDRIKIVGYLNGEGQIKYIDLKEEKVNPN